MNLSGVLLDYVLSKVTTFREIGCIYRISMQRDLQSLACMVEDLGPVIFLYSTRLGDLSEK